MPGPKSDKQWSDAIRVAVHRKDLAGRKKLNVLAEKVVEEALTGDMTAMKEIGDRLDGKPHQTTQTALEHSGNITFKTVYEDKG